MFLHSYVPVTLFSLSVKVQNILKLLLELRGKRTESGGKFGI